MRWWIVPAAVATSMATAQLPQASKAGTDAQTAVKRGDYLAAHRLLDGAAFGPDGKPADFFTYQMWQQITPMLTGELPLDALGGGRPPVATDPDLLARVRKATSRPAIAEIVRRARLTSIVILNEAHYSPRDRAFALQVARALRPLGYRNLAAETFNQSWEGGLSPAIARLVADRAVTRGTGFYTLDPVFARYVNEALRLSYEPVAYESSPAQNARGPGIQPREDGEAENLMAFLHAHPGAKLLVHVGHGHVNEVSYRGTDGVEYFMMAARLKQLTGVDPLTIDQTIMSDLQPAMRDAYPVAAAKVGRAPGILFEDDHPLPTKGAGTDLRVVHPARRYRDGRPAWLAALGGHPVALPRALLPASGERLVQAFAADAPADAVPLDQVLVTAGKPTPKLMLPRGVRVRYATQR